MGSKSLGWRRGFRKAVFGVFGAYSLGCRVLGVWGNIRVILGLCRDNGKKMEIHWGVLGLNWGYMGIMEEKMETHWCNISVILGS